MIICLLVCLAEIEYFGAYNRNFLQILEVLALLSWLIIIYLDTIRFLGA